MGLRELQPQLAMSWTRALPRRNCSCGKQAMCSAGALSSDTLRQCLSAVSTCMDVQGRGAGYRFETGYSSSLSS